MLTQNLLHSLELIIKAIGADKVGLRLSPSGTFNDMTDSNPQKHFTYICNELNKYKLAYLHIIDALEGDIRHGANVVELSILRDAYKGILIVNGGYNKEKGNKAIKDSLADAVTFGELFISNPDLPERFKTNSRLNKADPETFYSQDEKGYTDYPTLT